MEKQRRRNTVHEEKQLVRKERQVQCLLIIFPFQTSRLMPDAIVPAKAGKGTSCPPRSCFLQGKVLGRRQVDTEQTGRGEGVGWKGTQQSRRKGLGHGSPQRPQNGGYTDRWEHTGLRNLSPDHSSLQTMRCIDCPKLL